MSRRSAAAGPRPRGRPRAAAPCRPRSGRAGAGSRRPSLAAVLEHLDPAVRPAELGGLVRPDVDDRPDRPPGDIRASVRSWRGEKQMTRQVPRSPSARSSPSRAARSARPGRSAAKSLVNTNVVGVVRVPLAVRPDVARAQVAVGVVGRARRRPAGSSRALPRPPGPPGRDEDPLVESAGRSADAVSPRRDRATPVCDAVASAGTAHGPRVAAPDEPARVDDSSDDDQRSDCRARIVARPAPRPPSVMSTSASSSRAIELSRRRPTSSGRRRPPAGGRRRRGPGPSPPRAGWAS